MPRKITDQSEEEETVIDVGFEDTTGLKDDQDEAEAAILAQFDADEDNIEWTASIYEVGTKGEKDGWLFDCSMGDIIGVRQKLLDTYGTGLYRARIRRGNRLARFLTYRIVAPRVGPQTMVLEGPNPLAIAVQDQGRLLQNLVEKLGQAPQVPVQNNPMEMIGVMGGMFEMFAKMMPQPAANTGVDPMQMFELVLKGMELGKDNSGSGESNVIDLIRDVLKGVDLGSILTAPQIPAPGQRITGPRPIAPAAQPGQVPSTDLGEGEPGGPETPDEFPAPKTGQDIDPIVQGIVGHLAQFIPHAQRGADVGLYADVILDNAPRDAIMHVVTYPDIEAIFQASNPLIKENWEWFGALLNELRDILSGPEPMEPGLDEMPDLTDAALGSTAEPTQGVDVTGEVIPDVSKPDEQPTAGNVDDDPERSGRDESDASGNVATGEGGEEKPGSENSGG